MELRKHVAAKFVSNSDELSAKQTKDLLVALRKQGMLKKQDFKLKRKRKNGVKKDKEGNNWIY